MNMSGLPGLKYLRTFQVAAQHRSFKAAADELCVTPSAVSHQIKSLEERLGLSLFVRGSSSLDLSPAGQSYFEKLEPIFLRLERCTEDLVARYGRNLVQIHMPPFFSTELFLPRLESFQTTYPELDLKIETGIVGSGSQVHPKNMDLSITLGVGPWPDCEAVQLFQQRYVIACSAEFAKKHPMKSFSDLDGKTFIVMDRRESDWVKLAQDLSLPTLRPSKLVEVDSMPQLAKAAAKGLGITLLSWPMSKDWFDSQDLVRLFDTELTSQESYFLLHRPEDLEREEVFRLREWVLGEFQVAA